MRFRLATLLLGIAALSPSSISAVEVPSQTLHNGRRIATSTSQLFPFLTKLRDGAVEFLFGPPPRKPESPALGVPGAFLSEYADQVVVRFNLTTLDEEEALAESASRLLLDIWAFTEDYADVRVRKDAVASLLSLLPDSLRESYWTLIPDVAAAVYDSLPSSGTDRRSTFDPFKETPILIPSQADGDNVFFHEYRPLSVVAPWMRLMEAMFPSIARMTSIGTSYEGRDIPALKLGISRTEEETHKRKTLVISGGMHAREWISTTTVNYVAWSFLTSYGKVPMITKLLEHFDLVFIPAVNPDGMEYTWQVDRLWRKSRQETGLRFCRGFDLDHAFGFQWDRVGANRDPCSEGYGGAEPWEAVEAVALADWARNQTVHHNVRFVGLIDLHSYSQQVTYPFSYTCDVEPPNLENLEELAVGLAKAIRLSSGETYSVTSACEGALASRELPGRQVRIEAGGGSAIDWFYHEMGAHFSYQIKLRDTGSYGFLLPKENIVPTGEEMFNAMKYLGDYLLGNNGIEQVADEGHHTEAWEGSDRDVELRRVKRRK